MRLRRLGAAAGACLLAIAALPAQEREDRTLLTTDQMRAIINEVSGERALHHVLDLVPYQFVRPPAEYQGHFRESEVMAKLAKAYGFSNVAIEDYPTGQTWQPVPLADVMAVLRARETAGAIKLVPKPAEPAPKKK